MALGFTKPRYSPIAIDFGADTIKLLQLSLGDAPQLIASASTVVPELYRGDGAGRLTFLADALRDLLKSQPFKGKRAICSIPAHQTLIQHIQLDKSEQDDFDSQVDLQLIQRYNMDPARMVVRTHKVGKIVRDGQSMLQVICIAARRDSVMRIIELANRCKLEVAGMHSEPIALVRAHPYITPCEPADGAVCYIDIGAGLTKLVIAHGKELAFAKTIHAGGDEITRAVAQKSGIEFDRARNQRLHAHAASASPAYSGAGGGPDAPPQTSSARPHNVTDDEEGHCFNETLIEELRLSLRYYQSVFPDKPVKQLIFLGGESQDVRLCQTIARAVHVSARLGDPFAGIDTLDEQASSGAVQTYRPMPAWAVPLGLCFSEANL